jgi:hypothetical protein
VSRVSSKTCVVSKQGPGTGVSQAVKLACILRNVLICTAKLMCVLFLSCRGQPQVYSRPDYPVPMATANIKAGGCIVHILNTVSISGLQHLTPRQQQQQQQDFSGSSAGRVGPAGTVCVCAASAPALPRASCMLMAATAQGMLIADVRFLCSTLRGPTAEVAPVASRYC